MDKDICRVWDKCHERYIYSTEKEFCFTLTTNGKVLISAIDGEELIPMYETDKAEWFTGITDENRKKIFDGDNIRYWVVMGGYKKWVLGTVSRFKGAYGSKCTAFIDGNYFKPLIFMRKIEVIEEQNDVAG